MQSNDLYDDTPTSSDAADADSSKMENIAALGKNPKTSRVIIATVAAITVVGGLALTTVMSRNRAEQQPQQPPANMGGTVAVGSAPGSLNDFGNPALKTSPEYKAVVDEASAARALAASEAGTSSQPLSITLEAGMKPIATPAEIEAKAQEEAKKRKAEEVAQSLRDSALQPTQPAQPQAQTQYQPQPYTQQDPAVQAQHAKAQEAIAALMARRERGAMVVSFGEAAPAPNAMTQSSPLQQGGNNGQVGVTTPNPNLPRQQATQSWTLMEAGRIEAARIETAMNTDIGGDFAATLITGKYAGAKLIGTYGRKGERAVAQVRLISFPSQGVSLPAQATLLDAETSEGGTATDVDRKLFVKYGIKPLAAGFAAVAEYLKNDGTTVIVNGAVVTSKPELTGKRTGQLVAGSAAQQVAGDVNALDTTPTVRVARGAVVGVFFTADVIYSPQSQQ